MQFLAFETPEPRVGFRTLRFYLKPGEPKLVDYLISQEGLDWSTLLAPWAAKIPSAFTLWMVNRFGDPFIVDGGGAVQWLPLDAGQPVTLARSRDEFAELIDQDDNFNQWFLVNLVDALVEHDVALSAGRCYGFVIHPILGGEYSLDNIRTFPLAEYYGYVASVLLQIEGLPDGSRVRLKITE